MNKTVKKILISLLCVFLALLLAVGSYAAYVLISYSRIEDFLSLEVSPAAEENAEIAESVRIGTTYTAVSFNIGFGAYTPDFTFFMDGGKESRAESKELTSLPPRKRRFHFPPILRCFRKRTPPPPVRTT